MEAEQELVLAAHLTRQWQSRETEKSDHPKLLTCT